RCRGPIALSLAARPDVAHQPRPRGAPHLIFFIVFPPGRLQTSRAHPLLRRAHDAPLRADGPGGDPARTFAYRTHCRIPNICRTLQHSSQIPADALLVAEGRKQVHYAAAIACGVMSIGVGLIAPAFTGFILAMPAAFIGTLAGVAMFTPLKNAFLAGFSG